MGPYYLILFLVGYARAREQAPIHACAVRLGARAAMAQPYFKPYFDTVIGDSNKGNFITKHNTTQIKDFRLPQMMHTPLTIWTYNCQRMSNAHKKDWDLMLGKQNHIWLMQGTQETYSPSRGEKPLQRSSTANYDIWESKALRRRGPAGQFFSPPEGVAVWAPKGLSAILKNVFIPDDIELQGRGMILHFERGPFSYAVGTVYSPICIYGPKNIKLNRKLWNWVQKTKQELPSRTPLIIGTDANGHVGSHASNVVPRNDDEEELAHIGPYAPEKENSHGTILREFLEATDMIAVNTHVRSEAGHTWTGGRNKRNRVDFILMDRSLYLNGGTLKKDRAMHGKLRHSVGKTEGDHIPLRWTFLPKPWFTPPNLQDECDHKKMIRSCQTRDDKMKTYVQTVEDEFKTIWMRHQPTMDDSIGYTEVLRELEDTLIQTATDIWKKQPILSKAATGLGSEAHLLSIANQTRRETYKGLTETIYRLQAEVDNQALILHSVHKLQYIKVARKDDPPLIIFPTNVKYGRQQRSGSSCKHGNQPRKQPEPIRIWNTLGKKGTKDGKGRYNRRYGRPNPTRTGEPYGSNADY